MRIDQATVGTGTDDTSRVDGVPNQLVTLNWVGTGSPVSYLWQFWDYAGDQTVPTISNATTATATFTPNGGATGYGQTFGIELVIDGSVTSRRTFKIATQREQLLLPAYAEVADPDGSRQNMGAPVIATSTDNAASNYRGWAPALVSTQKAAEKWLGLFSITPNPSSVYGDVETRLGGAYLQAGTLNTFGAEMGCLVGTDQAILRLYRQSDDTLITTVTRTNTLGIATGTNVTIAQAGMYEVRGLCNNSTGTAIFASVWFDAR
jgi:hypothetical protein